MELNKQEPEGLAPAGGVSAPILPKTAAFSASRRELLAALCMYLLAWVYWELDENLYLALFTLGFVAMTEWLHWGRPRARESWVWLGCMGLLLAAILLGRCRAWENGFLAADSPRAFLHVFAVWWVLSRSGTLVEGESGHLLPLDALDGFVVFPFKHFFLRIRCLWYALTHLPFRTGRVRPAALAWSGTAVLAALLLFDLAARLLMAADAGFDRLLSSAMDLLHFDWGRLFSPERFIRLLIGAWLFGLLAGTVREDREALRGRGAAVCRSIAGLRKVPDRVWTALTAAFCLLYLLFFVVQARYLFGAFTRSLPEGFIVSQYAREGFFELCKVMAVNFGLLWLVSRLSRTPVGEDRVSRLACLILLGESLLFAVVAASKLWLYIDCFGFTPLRLQSCWLVAVLAAGCVCAAVRLLTGRRCFRAWMIFGAVSLCLLCLY